MGTRFTKTIEIARLAVQTGLYPLVEFSRGRQINAMLIREPKPVSEYLKLQKRFSHLFQEMPKAKEELHHLQELANYHIETYALLGKSSKDTESVDTVRRGGVRWG